MGDLAILLPSVAMALFTLVLILYMGVRRVLAVRRRRISIRFFRAFRGDDLPEDLHILIHLTYNNVNHRFLVYGFGLLLVAALWVNLLLAVLAAA